jgi:RNA polymerase sigma factor (sigma-70 family)
VSLASLTAILTAQKLNTMKSQSKHTPNCTIKSHYQLVKDHAYVIDQVIVSKHFDQVCRVLEYNDLWLAGYIYLDKAAEHYDSSKGTKFSSFAYGCIYNGILDTIRKEEFHIRVPKNKVNGDYQPLIPCCSLDELLENENYDMEDEESQDIYAMMEDCLDEREYMVLTHKYGLKDDPWSSIELAEALHVTPQTVNRIKRNALDKLRAAGA